MIFLSENDLNDDVIIPEDEEEVEGESLGLEPSTEAGLAIEGMASDMYHNITEAVLMADAKEYALRARAELYEQTGRSSEAQDLLEKADALQEGVLKDMWGKIKAVFIKMWNWIKGLFMDFVKWIRSFISNSKAYAEKYGEQFLKAVDKLDNKWEFKGYKFVGMSKLGNGIASALKATNGVIDATKKVLSKSDSDVDMEEIKSEKNQVDNFRAIIIGKSGKLTADQFTLELKKAIYGSEEKVSLYKADIKSIASTMIKDMKSENRPVKSVKEIQDKTNSKYSEVIKLLENIQAVLDRAEGKEKSAATKKSKAITKAVSDLRGMLSVTNTVCSSYMGAWKTYMNQSKSIIAHTFSYRKNANESFTNESTSILDELMAMIS